MKSRFAKKEKISVNILFFNFFSSTTSFTNSLIKSSLSSSSLVMEHKFQKLNFQKIIPFCNLFFILEKELFDEHINLKSIFL